MISSKRFYLFLIVFLLIASSTVYANSDIDMGPSDISQLTPKYRWETIVEAKWDGIRKLGNFYLVEKNEGYSSKRYGLLDSQGKTIFQPIYNAIILVDDNHALAQRNKSGKPVEMVGMNGKVAFTLPPDSIVDQYFNGQAVVTVPGSIGLGSGGKQIGTHQKAGVIDSKGKFVIPMNYESLFALEDSNLGVVMYNASKLFGQSFTAASGIIDRSGKVILPLTYQSLSFSRPASQEDNRSMLDKKLIVVQKKDKYGVITIAGKTVIPLVYDEIVPDYYLDEQYNSGTVYFRDDVAVIRKGDKFGVIDRNGKILIPLQYDEITSMQETVWTEDEFEVDGTDVKNKETQYLRLKIGKKYGMADRKGKVIAKVEWNEISEFQAGLTRVIKGKKYAFIDKTGKFITPLVYDLPKDLEENHHPQEGIIIITQSEKYGFMTTTGKVISKPQWDAAMPFRNEYARVKKGGKWGFIDKTGNVLLVPQWDEVSNFEQGWAVVMKGDKKDYIDSKGQVMLSLDTILEDYKKNNGLFGHETWGLSTFDESGYARFSAGPSTTYVIDRSGKVQEAIKRIGNRVGAFINGLARISAWHAEKVVVDALIDTEANLIMIYPDEYIQRYDLTWDSNQQFPENYTAKITIDGKHGVIALIK